MLNFNITKVVYWKTVTTGTIIIILGHTFITEISSLFTQVLENLEIFKFDIDNLGLLHNENLQIQSIPLVLVEDNNSG